MVWYDYAVWEDNINIFDTPYGYVSLIYLISRVMIGTDSNLASNFSSL